MERRSPAEEQDNQQLQDVVLEEWRERAAQLHPDDTTPAKPEVNMGQNMPQGAPTSRQHGRKPGQEPADIDQDRGSYEPGSHPPGGDGEKTTPDDEKSTKPTGKGNKPNSPQPGS
jgi:hypothetical protein